MKRRASHCGAIRRGRQGKFKFHSQERDKGGMFANTLGKECPRRDRSSEIITRRNTHTRGGQPPCAHTLQKPQTPRSTGPPVRHTLEVEARARGHMGQKGSLVCTRSCYKKKVELSFRQTEKRNRAFNVPHACRYLTNYLYYYFINVCKRKGGRNGPPTVYLTYTREVK